MDISTIREEDHGSKIQTTSQRDINETYETENKEEIKL